MIKNKLDFKLVNIALLAVIVFFIYESSGLWIGILDKILKIILPLFAGFVIAYALYPGVEFLVKHKVPKGLAIFLLIALIVGIVVTILVLLVPLLANQIVSLVDGLGIFIKNFSTDYHIDFGTLGDTLMNSFNQIIASVGKYVSDGAVKTINTSINVLTNVVIALASSIYFLLDMNKIRDAVKKYLSKKSKQIYDYVATLDYEIKKYLKGFMQIVAISFFEYTVVYYIIGHPNALLLGFLAALANFIPYFGGTLIEIVAAITAFVVSPSLFVKVLIAAVICSMIDMYLINPLVYGKSNEVHPLIVITSVFAGGILFGFVGIIISLPLSILIITSIKFYRENVKKDNKKKIVIN